MRWRFRNAGATEERTVSYRQQFMEASRAAEYEQAQWSADTYPSLVWREVERRFFEDFLDRSPVPAEKMDYLDFACGTGRVLEFMEPRVRSARGIDLSPAMLEIARKKVRRADLLCVDITADAPVEGRYDLITAFRFLLNAEPELRLRAMEGLARRMKDQASRLLLDNHGNSTSYKALRWPNHWTRTGQPRYESAGNLMRHKDVVALLDRCGLVVEEVYGYGFLGGAGLRALPRGLVRGIERTLSGRPGVERVGVHQLYVCRLRASPLVAT